MYVDDASNVRGWGIGIVMVPPKGSRIEKSLRLDFRALNNEAEYEALIVDYELCKNLVSKRSKSIWT